MQNPAFRTYLENKILTATPEQLQLMLYEGLIRFSQTARAGLEEKNYEKAQMAFERAGAVLCELVAGLRPDRDASLCEKFAGLYTFCIRRLVDANLHHDVQLVDEALLVMNQLREIWIAVLEKIAAERAEAAQSASPGESLAVQM